ncbi:hypothetical protein LOC68_18590 [Blastopirellula sp. JC732]|uniref:GlsB/YeaQ/YmgE family stress response membrane protein n=1 Tax=Blastopirellula sediminis TaxID=2894196 RepID=A0A9X1MQ52_9BACT|nr:hypothetical protein [Blastopirellula sediminis]MCC9606295.1 hypothetical protein [Blastopirellula sediminis]MCC9630407.1 hypothetical protein [Blastopirellula sediminis]
MTFFEILLFLIVAAICGGVARSLAGGTNGGCFVSIAVAFVGSMLGGKLAQISGMPEPLPITIGGTQLPIVWSIIGGAIFVAALRMISGARS